MNEHTSTTNAQAIDLDDESMAMLLDEVAAMAATGRPLASGLADLDDVSMGKLGRAAKSIQSSLAAGKNASDSVASLSTKYRGPIAVAIETMARTRSTEPIHGVVRLIREANQHRRQLRLAAINPLLNLMIASTILFFVVPWLLVTLAEIEPIKSAFAPTAVQIFQRFAKNFWLAATGAIVSIAMGWWLIRWTQTRSTTRIDLFNDHAVFSRWLSMQVKLSSEPNASAASNLELGRLIESSSEVSSSEFAKGWQSVVKNIRGGAQSMEALAMPEGTPKPIQQCVLDLVGGRRDGDSVAFDLQRLSELYTQIVRVRRTWWIEFLPRIVTWIMMIIILLILLRTILQPLFDLITEVV